jgi:hypothetical protein
MNEEILHVDVDEGYRVKVYGKVTGKYDDYIGLYKEFLTNGTSRPLLSYITRVFNTNRFDSSRGYIVSSAYINALYEECKGTEPITKVGTLWYSKKVIKIIDSDELFLYVGTSDE